jgi:hypothetical protein
MNRDVFPSIKINMHILRLTEADYAKLKEIDEELMQK